MMSLSLTEFKSVEDGWWIVPNFITPGYPYLATLSIEGEEELVIEVARSNFTAGKLFKMLLLHEQRTISGVYLAKKLTKWVPEIFLDKPGQSENDGVSLTQRLSRFGPSRVYCYRVCSGFLSCHALLYTNPTNLMSREWLGTPMWLIMIIDLHDNKLPPYNKNN